MEAFVELRGRLLETDRKMKQLAKQEAAIAQEKRRAELTLAELSSLPEATKAYSGVGKAFVLQPLEALKEEQKAVISKCQDAQDSLEPNKKYLEKQMKEVQRSFQELMQQVPGLAQQLMQLAPPSAQ